MHPSHPQRHDLQKPDVHAALQRIQIARLTSLHCWLPQLDSIVMPAQGVMMTMYGLDYWQPWSWKLAGETLDKHLKSPPTEQQLRVAAGSVSERRQGVAVTAKLPENPTYRTAIVPPQPLLTASILDGGAVLPSVRCPLMHGHCLILDP